MTDTKDTHGKRTEKRWFRGRGSGLVRLLFLGLLITFVLGCERCDQRAPTITCQAINLVVESGTRTEIKNPCHPEGRWGTFDGFRLCPPPETQNILALNGIFLERKRTGNQVTYWLNVGADSARFTNLIIPFLYGRTRRDGEGLGSADLVLTVVDALLTVAVTATPETIAVGESSQLVAAVRGGTPPYFYSWIPNNSLDDADIAAPIASPSRTTEYTVVVQDSGALQKIGSLTVFVGMDLTVTATPQIIVAGESSQLFAQAAGGTPPYTFAWTPADTLDEPHRQDPTATPATTTTYHVTARDSAGATRQGSATVVVRLGVTVTANPEFISPGESSQLNSVAVGGTPPYSYSWTPADTLNGPNGPNPIATPTTSTFYHLLISDSTGAQAASGVTITVTSSPPPAASFVFNVTCCQMGNPVLKDRKSVV